MSQRHQDNARGKGRCVMQSEPMGNGKGRHIFEEVNNTSCKEESSQNNRGRGYSIRGRGRGFGGTCYQCGEIGHRVFEFP